MVLPRFRSKSARRVAVKAPTGRAVLHFKSKRPSKAACRICGAVLGGVTGSCAAAKSEKVPSRMFAGELCHACTSELISLKVRIGAGTAKPEDASMAQQKYLRMIVL